MAGETVITIVGNLVADPELSWAQSGVARCTFTVASTPRTFDRQSGQFKPGDALFLRCTAWREFAENIVESLTKGSRVIVQGRLVQHSYETKQGEKRTSYDVQVDEIGPSLRFANAKVTRSQRGEGGFGDGGAGGGSGGGFRDGGQGGRGGAYDNFGGGQGGGGFRGGAQGGGRGSYEDSDYGVGQSSRSGAGYRGDAWAEASEDESFTRDAPPF